MWFWQHKNVHEQRIVSLGILFVCSSIAHILFLVCFFVYYHHDIVHVLLTINSTEMPIMLAPVSWDNTSQKATRVVPIPTHKNSVQKKKRRLDATTVRSVKSGTVSKKAVIQKTKHVQQKKSKVTTVPKKMPESNVSKKPKPIEQKSVEKVTLPHHEVVPDSLVKKSNMQDEEVIHMNTPGGGVDAALAPYIYELQQDLVQHWIPPVGVSPECCCCARVIIDWDGNTQEIVIEQPSGILIYDMSVRTALLHTTFPAWVKGKSLVITFKQDNGLL